MPITYFDANTCIDYTENQYFVKRLEPDSFLITTEHGAWVVLNKREYDLLRLNQLHKDPNLFNTLEYKGIIVTERNIGHIVNIYRLRKDYLFKGVSLHIVAVTSKCNHRCPYCYTGLQKNGKDMDEDTAKAVVDFIFQSPSPVITIEISGGEPLMNFPVVEFIIEYSKKLNKKFGRDLIYILVTNLTPMDEDILKYLIKNNVSISTSLDGPKEVHDKNRKYLNGRSSYEKTVYWIDVIKKQYKYPALGALPVVTRHSLPYGKEIVDEYIKHDLNFLRLKYISPTGNAQKRWDKLGYTPEEYLVLWKKVLDYILKLNGKGLEFSEGLTTLMLKKILLTVDPLYVDLNMPCGAGIGQITYDEKGNIYTCDEARPYDIFKLGVADKNRYKEIIASRTVTSMVDISSGYPLMCDFCVWKPYCGVCGVISYAQQGNIIPKLPLDFRCAIHRGMFEHIFRKLLFSKEKTILMKWANISMF
ncbi:MAG: His-Xaa-Ser system radical SAM maturase HxsB [Candidatus Altiarchaeales archaeon]|nr:MAG: His-Xaa-Ser system radical SAM maturase HxsB [Candidatus Altiarchaeales archaeon]